MIFIKILITSLIFYIHAACMQRNVLQAQKGYSNNNFPNAKVFIPYVYPNKKDKSLIWSYRAVGYIRSDANITTRKYNPLQIPDVISFFPTQKDPDLFDGDANATPLVSFVDPIAHQGGIFNIQKDNHQVDIFIGGDFCGFVFNSGILTLENSYLAYSYKGHSLLLGQYLNPMRFEYNAPRVVSYNFGAPFASRAFNPQLSYTFHFDKAALSITAYTQFLYCSRGPIIKSEGVYTNAIPNYQQWSMLPSLNIKTSYDNQCNFEGIIAFDVKTIKPFIYTQVFLELGNNIPFINNNNVNSYALSAFFKLKQGHIFITSQIMYGNNAMDFYTFGGYGMRFFDEGRLGQKTFTKTTYAPIYFASGWLSLETTKIHQNFVPGIFVGYATNLPAKYPLQLNAYVVDTTPAQPATYSIDSRYDNSPFTLAGIKTLNSLKRISPRLWIYCNKHFLIGAEIELSYATYGYVNKYGTATICPEKVSMVRSTLSTQFAF